MFARLKRRFLSEEIICTCGGRLVQQRTAEYFTLRCKKCRAQWLLKKISTDDKGKIIWL